MFSDFSKMSARKQELRMVRDREQEKERERGRGRGHASAKTIKFARFRGSGSKFFLLKSIQV